MIQPDKFEFFLHRLLVWNSKIRLIVSLLHIFLGILSPRMWPNGHREVKDRMKELLRMEWRGMAFSASGWSVALLTARCGCR